jgi:pimeloyl-ACP methyl ester carboxylesterase
MTHTTVRRAIFLDGSESVGLRPAVGEERDFRGFPARGRLHGAHWDMTGIRLPRTMPNPWCRSSGRHVRGRRVVTTALVVVLLASVLVPGLPARPHEAAATTSGATTARATGFVDVGAGHAFATEITWGAQHGLLQGWPDGTFRPTTTLTRQAYVAFLYRLLAEPDVPAAPVDRSATGFSDVPPGHPFVAEITWAAEVGLVQGWPDGSFRPTAPVTRQAAAAFSHRAGAMVEAQWWTLPGPGTIASTHVASPGGPGVIGPAAERLGVADGTAGTAGTSGLRVAEEPPVPPLYPDVAGDHRFVFDIAAAEGLDLLRGFDDGTFRPSLPLTRQAAAAVLFRMGALADPGYTPVWADAACTTPTPTDRVTDCGTLTVPEDRSDPTGPTIELAVAIVRTNHADPLPDGAVYLGGGPGGTVVDGLRGRYKVTLGEQRDVVLFDQRGVGLSVPDLNCPERDEALLDAYGTADSFPVEHARIVDASLECRARLVGDGVRLASYNTIESALDVRDLRRVLGYEQWNVYGVSYGTALAQRVVGIDPFGTRSVIYDSAYPLDATLASRVAEGGERVFDQLWAGCAAHVGCADTHGDLEATFWDTVAAYDAEPLAVTIPDPLGAGDRDLLITGADITAGLFGALYRTEFIPVLPLVIDAIATRDVATMELVATQGLGGIVDLVDGVFLSVECHDRWDGISRADLEALVATAPHFGSVYYTVVDGYCEDWDVPMAPPRFNRLPTTPVPGLVLAGSYDPVTPPEGGQDLAGALATAHYVEFPQWGHGVLSNANVCANDLARQFLNDGTGPLDLACMADQHPPDFQ